MITNFYRVFDFFTKWLVAICVNQKSVLRTIAKEIHGGMMERYETNQKWSLKKLTIADVSNHINNLHGRISALLSHVSIIIVVLIFSLDKFQPEGSAPIHDNILIGAIIVELVLYLFIAILCLRCLRGFGLEKPYSTQENWSKDSINEIVYRFSCYRLLNFATIVGTIFYIAILVIKFWPL